MITLFVFALIIAIVILVAGSRNRKQGDKETTGEYLERQREERNIEIAFKVAAGATAAGAFFGVAKAIDKLTTFKGEYSFSLKSIVRWFSECFKLKETIINSRSGVCSEPESVISGKLSDDVEDDDEDLGDLFADYDGAASKKASSLQCVYNYELVKNRSKDPTSYKRGFEWITDAANQGFDEAQFILGKYELDEHNFEVGIEWITKAANQGFHEAQLFLGEYERDNLNFKQAKSWFELAAAQEIRRKEPAGGSRGLYELSQALLKEAKAGTKDYARGIELLKKSCSKYNRKAMPALAKAYAADEGSECHLVGLDKNNVLSLAWIKAFLSHDMSMRMLFVLGDEVAFEKELSARMTEKEKSAATKLAKNWCPGTVLEWA